MIEHMTTTPGVGDGALGIAPAEAVRAPITAPVPKTPDAAQIAANTALAADIEADLTANPPRIDAALADAADLPAPEVNRAGLSPDEIQELGNNAAVFIRDHPIPESTGFIQESKYEQADLIRVRDQLPLEIGQRFDAHGIAKGGYKDQLASLNTFLTTGIDPAREFHTVPLKVPPEIEAQVASAMGGLAYDTGNFIILSKPDGMIKTKENPKGEIAAVLVNEAFYDAIPRLQEAYPGVKFIRADQMTEGLSEMLAKPEGNGEAPRAITEPPPQPPASSGNANIPEGFTAGPPRLETVGPDHIYDHPDLDPELSRLEAQIVERTNAHPDVQSADRTNYSSRYQAVRDIEEVNAWDAYIARYPEKAKAYAEKGHFGLSEAIARKAKRDANLATPPEVAPTPITPEANRGLSSDEVQALAGKAQRFIEEHPNEVVDGEEFPYDPYMLVDARRSIPQEIASQFDAHGIAKGTTQDLISLNNLLTNGIDLNASFFTASLDSRPNAAAINVKDNGSFIVVGKPGQTLKDGGIGGVIVHEAYYDAIPRLQEAFPNVKFIKASEVNQGLSEMISPPEAVRQSTSSISSGEQIVDPRNEPDEELELDESLSDPDNEPVPTAPGKKVFTLVDEAREELRMAETRGGLGVEDRRILERRIAEAEAKEALLRLNMEIFLEQTAKRDGRPRKMTDEELAKAVKQRDDAYKKAFESAETRAKAKNREYSSELAEMESEAKLAMKEAKKRLNEAESTGKTEDIALMRMAYEAYKSEYDIIKRKKRKEGLINFLSAIGLSFIVNSVRSTTGQVSGGINSNPRQR